MTERETLQEEPIPLRAHHVARIGALEAELPLYAESLVKSPVGYVDSPDHPYVNNTFRFLDDLRKHPDQLIKVTAGTGGDYICDICPVKARCPDFNPLSEDAPINHDPNRADQSYAKESNYEVGKVYTVADLLERSKKKIEFLKMWFAD
jgi:hypothetical protein